MKRNVVCFTFLACLFQTTGSDLVSAATLNLQAIDRGWYDLAGFHYPLNWNYVAGDVRGPDGKPSPSNADFHNFFVFDLASVFQPIRFATLVLYLPSPNSFAVGLSGGYDSNDPSETFEVHDVVTSISALLSGTGGVAAHTDLGDGAVYGSRVITPADLGTLVEIDLSSTAIANMNNSHSRFAIGGKLTTLDDLANDEAVFAWTNDDINHITELRLTLIPEPTSLTLFSIAAVMLGISRCRTRQD